MSWDKQLVGPIFDEQGVEQGGINSGEFYKIFGKEQLENAQISGLGVPLYDLIISGIGQADDTALASNHPESLLNLHRLSMNFCSKYQVELCPEKTKLQVFSTKGMSFKVEYLKNNSNIKINGCDIKYVETAEHVGITRSTAGNLAHILGRVTAHKQALGAVLHSGLARAHRGNPAAGLKVAKLHALPVLLSGIGSLVLKKSEIDILDLHHKHIIDGILRLHPGTPHCVSLFLAGSLSGKAYVHLRQLSLFGMICRLPDNILYHHAVNALTMAKPSYHSWFTEIRNLCIMYDLPHPSILLQAKHSRDSYKKLVKSHVFDYWERKLREKAASLLSLEFFKPAYLSLKSPHPIMTSAGSSPYFVNMAKVQLIMISGRYRTEALASHWSPSGSKNCQTPQCIGLGKVEDLRHILAECESLDATRNRLSDFTGKYSDKIDVPEIRRIIETYCSSQHPDFCQFLVDCSVLPVVIRAAQEFGSKLVHEHLFRITRTWCYCLHRDRLRILGRWKHY